MPIGPSPWHSRAVYAVAAGGVAGSTCRWMAIQAWPSPGRWPWPTFTVNVVGCLLLGVFATVLPFAADRAILWREGLSVGFCGGLTTFSTFAVELARMLRADRAALAAGYLAASLAVGWLAYEVARRVTHRRVTPRRVASDRSPV